ncbi:MATE family efflux transporter [Chryseobacterium sp. PTM-20240506]|uniref:MATE family efflux transporter n=1 Tax=unclassified Chryseobacterium TaxID=2593645 RepID=UPI00235955EA|nr:MULTISPECIES: MATE family efflux transporter [unclassified Chryseobacterium]MDC8103566.1 MATE family efflux transporter [Chryseobacterium sp. B21-037]MDQ1803173.1 MATE family efflux transporter [Chryseobacterium sp. CKR4-1]WBV57100.1 MATE family efflux transporter [Chryseobacterium daecheongense]
MSYHKKTPSKGLRYFTLLKQSLLGTEMDYTTGNINKAVILLAIPMMLEMIMESVFALVDLYFVGHLENSSYAIQTVGLTESVLTVMYSIAIGMSMAATAVVSRRVGEKDPDAAAHAGMQAIIVAFAVTLVLSIAGMIYAGDILRIMGASKETVDAGVNFTRIMMGSSLVIMLLFLINGIFRGAGNAAIAMRSLWIANICNIILCPIFINGWGIIPAFGLTGAAMATVIGRSMGVVYQLFCLFNGKHQLKIKLHHFRIDWPVIKSLVGIATPGILQFVIGSCSWIFLAELVATTGGDHGSAGYQTALRLMMFFMLPAWGMSNAAATLVGQNLGAKQFQRAEDSVLATVKYNVIFMIIVTILFLFFGDWLVSFFTNDIQIKEVAQKAMWIMSTAFVFYGIGMVMMNALNGAGDTKTPTWINFFGFWFLQIPLAYILTKHVGMGPTGVFIAIPVAETAIAITTFIFFKRGKWKTVNV